MIQSKPMVKDSGSSLITDERFPITDEIYNSISSSLGLRQDDYDTRLWDTQTDLCPIRSVSSLQGILSGRMASISDVPRDRDGNPQYQFRREFNRLYLDQWFRYEINNFSFFQTEGYKATLWFKAEDNDFQEKYNLLRSLIMNEINHSNYSEFDGCIIEDLELNYADYYEINIEIENEDQYIETNEWDLETVIPYGILTLKYVTRYIGFRRNVLDLHFELSW